MSARKTRLVLGVAAVCACFGISGCASHREAEKKQADASTYNTQLGISYLREGDIPLAKEKLDRALKENPQNPQVHSARAMLFDRMGEPAQADNEFKEALRLDPNDPDVNNNYAVYLCQTGRATEGVKRFETVARNALYRTPWVAYSNAGVCLRSAKRDPEAVRNFKQALSIRPNFAEAAYQLGDLEETPDMLFLGVRVARAQNDRVAVALYSRKLRLDFPSSAQTKALADLEHNPG
jgi:type IV pilus assembly protein PilF